MVGKLFRVMFSRLAKRRLKEITEHAADAKSKAVGQHVRHGILTEARKLEKLPGSRPVLPDTEKYDYKVYYAKAWNYKIIFRILDPRNIVRVLTIRHDKELDEEIRMDLK